MKFLKIACVALALAAAVYSVAVAFPALGRSERQETPAYEGILTLWHTDSFEGGVGARSQFLLRRAAEFEKKHPGVLISVQTYTAEGLAEKLKAGETPDLVSYGLGTELSGAVELTADYAFSAGEYDGQFALPWCMGGYVLIANPSASEIPEPPYRFDSLLVSKNPYGQPLAALALEGYTAGQLQVLDPMDAYVSFVGGKIPYFLGTQRDLHRLERRNFEVLTRPLTQYDDLYQCISVLSETPARAYYAQAFVAFLLSEPSQKKLEEIGMWSAYWPVPSENAHVSALAAAAGGRSLSLLTDRLRLDEFYALSVSAAQGDEAALKNLKNFTGLT